MGKTEDWSEFIPAPVDSEVIELAGKWKHGWIPLDATAVSSKTKGKGVGGSGGNKKWWSGDGKTESRKAIGVPKPADQTVDKKRIAQSREPQKGDSTAFKTVAARNRDRLQKDQNQAAGTKTLNVGQVPGAKAQRKPEVKPGAGTKPYQRGKIDDMRTTTEPHPLTRSRKPISQMSDRERTDEANRADKMAERQPDRSAEWKALAGSLRSGKAPTAGSKPVDVTKRRLTGSGQAVRTLGSDADRLAANYVEMHGTDEARKKLAALKKVKTKDARKNELIAALQKLVGGNPGKA